MVLSSGIILVLQAITFRFNFKIIPKNDVRYLFITTATLRTTHRNRDGYETIKVSKYGLLHAQKIVNDDYKQKTIIH